MKNNSFISNKSSQVNTLQSNTKSPKSNSQIRRSSNIQIKNTVNSPSSLSNKNNISSFTMPPKSNKISLTLNNFLIDNSDNVLSGNSSTKELPLLVTGSWCFVAFVNNKQINRILKSRIGREKRERITLLNRIRVFYYL